MLSKIAKNDLEALRSAGYQPTDEEIVQLNDIAIRIERGKETTPANMPRIAVCGNAVLHEPTIGALQWWNDYGKDAAWSSDGRLMTYYFCLANARRLDLLSSLVVHSDIRKAVKEWKKKLQCTEDELWRGLCWVKYGDQSLEDNIDKDKIQTSIDDEQQMNAMWMTVIASSGALGLSPNDLKTFTQSELIGSLMQANLHARIPMKQSVAKDYIAYRQIMRKIEERGTHNE